MILCPIFISSADSYADLWPTFFELFKRYWPEYQGTIYLNTESLEFQYPGLDIRCTKVGPKKSFGKTFRAGLTCVESDHLLLMMIDYFFIGKVDDAKMHHYFQAFEHHELSSLCLMPNRYDSQTPLNDQGLDLVVPPSKDMFSYQIAFWKKKSLWEMALPHESPWLSEWYGTARANRMGLRLAVSNDTPIPYFPEGALHKGKWIEAMIQILNSEHFKIDFSHRGIFTETKASLLSRLRGRLQTFWPRLLSRIELHRRRKA